MKLRIQTQEGCITATDAPAHEDLARVVWLYAGLAAPSLCGGLGRCGACRVRLTSATGVLPDALPIERDVLGPATDDGWRLACRHRAGALPADTLIMVPPGARETAAIAPVLAATGALCLAVDLGTTSIHWQALNATGEVVAGGQALNPQAGAGSDVVSRLAAAADPAVRRRLSEAVRHLLQRLVHELERAPRVDGAGSVCVTELCVAANTAMTAIFLDVPVDGLLAAPYRCPVDGDALYALPDLPPVWVPPQPAPFVGGDIAAGMAWALHSGQAFPFLLADMGTNGECVLALDPHTAYVTSVPLGPAIEGIGLSCGGLAGPGSVTRFALGPTGLTPEVWGGGAPRSLCGAGVLSLLALLRRIGLLTEEGLLAAPQLPLAQRLAATVTRGADGWRIPLPGGLWLSAHDVETVLKVRAAFVVALASLMRAAGCAPADLAGLLLAGGLGEHAPLDALDALGFVPRGLLGRTRAVGNTALAGAGLLLTHPERRAELATWSAACTVVDVTAAPDFMERFTAAMRL